MRINYNTLLLKLSTHSSISFEVRRFHITRKVNVVDSFDFSILLSDTHQNYGDIACLTMIEATALDHDNVCLVLVDPSKVIPLLEAMDYLDSLTQKELKDLQRI